MFIKTNITINVDFIVWDMETFVTFLVFTIAQENTR
jgi:hypothetical protein